MYCETLARILIIMIGVSICISLSLIYMGDRYLYEFLKSREGKYLIKYLENTENNDKFKKWLGSRTNIPQEYIIKELETHLKGVK